MVRINENTTNSFTSEELYEKVDSVKRQALIKLVINDGKSIKEASSTLDMKYDNARRIIMKAKRSLQNFDVNLNTTKRGAPTKLSEQIISTVEHIVEENSSYTIKRIKELLYEREGILLSVSTINRILFKLKITLKLGSLVLDKVNDPDTIQKRKAYAVHFTSFSPENKDNCIFVDESGFNSHMHRSYARSQRGSRATLGVPTIRGRMKTLIVAASKRGIIHHKIISDGTCNSVKFSVFIDELISILDRDPSYDGSWIIMDNARIHGVQEVKNKLRDSAYRLEFLSPYSYMLNPVENIFSKIKLHVRSVLSEQFNRNVSVEIEDIINEAINTVTTNDCVNYVLHMMRNISLSLAESNF